MSRRINKILIFVTIFSIVAFLVIAGFNPVFAEEAESTTNDAQKTIASGIEWIKSLSVDEIKGWIGAAIAFLATGVGSIILLVIKIAYDSVKRTKLELERKKEKTEADQRAIDLCNKFVESEQKAQDKVIELMRDFANQYNIKLTTEVNNAVESQKRVLDAYADKIKELEKNEE